MFNSANSLLSLPPQMIPLKDKTDAWKKDCMDSLESIAVAQYNHNLKLVENYEMVQGKFIMSHYINKSDYADLITALTEEFEIPSYLRHYDIISQAINTLCGEFQKRPDLFKVKGYDENTSNNYKRRKTDLLLQYVFGEINNYVTEKLIQEGLDPEKKDFQSEEEAQQYQQLLAERTEALTPKDIQSYMDFDWMDAAEIWSEHQLSHDEEKYKLKEKDNVEFKDMLIADRCFRHFYLTPSGYNIETWNPIYTFFHKSPEIKEVELGDYVGRIMFMTISEIINRYGTKMTTKQLSSLEKYKRESYNNGSSGFDAFGNFNNVTPGRVSPYQDYSTQKGINNLLGYDITNPINTSNLEIALGGNDGVWKYDGSIIFQVTEAYWIGQEKIGRLTILDEETGEPYTILVSENFDKKLFPEVKERNSTFADEIENPEINSLVWTYVNVCYKGIKINNTMSNDNDALYVDIGRNEIQFKGSLNLYGCTLPVCGQVFNNRNSDSMSFVDLAKPYQIGFNVCMNQLYQIMQREIGRFFLMDSSFVPNGKDWGGERNYEKVMLVAKQLGIAPLDGSNANAKQSNFSHFQVIDLDESSRMMSRINIANVFEQFALKQLGITPQRLGSIMASESATGVQQSLNQSYAQTESYFTRFSEYKKRCLQMNLDIAQYVQSRKENISITYTKSDMSRAFIELSSDELLMKELGVFVSDSQELNRQLELTKQFFMNNNTIGATPVDIMTAITSNSPAEIKIQMEKSMRLADEKVEAQRNHEQQMNQQQIESQQQIAQMQIDKEDERLDKKLANDRYIAEIKAMATSNIGLGMDTDNSGIPDALEIQKFNQQINKDSEDILFKRQEAQDKRVESLNKQNVENKKIKLEEKKLEVQEKLKNKELEFKEKELKNKVQVAKYNDKGRYSGNNKSKS